MTPLMLISLSTYSVFLLATYYRLCPDLPLVIFPFLPFSFFSFLYSYKGNQEHMRKNLFHCFSIAIMYINTFLFICILKNDEDKASLGECLHSGREIGK